MCLQQGIFQFYLRKRFKNCEYDVKCKRDEWFTTLQYVASFSLVNEHVYHCATQLLLSRKHQWTNGNTVEVKIIDVKPDLECEVFKDG